ncbi:MAG: molybdate transport system substrate-binding protein [Polaribacter sp.]|jgi:molybdate transport system substrate-binding protein
MLLKQLICLLALTVTLTNNNQANAKTLRIAVASNFLETSRELAKAFEETSEHSIQISSGSSGKIYLQIKNGAPFDLFLSADSHKPNELVKDGLAVVSSQKTYAIGKLMLWLKDCSTQVSLTSLSSKRVKKIAIANPKLAPYGYASKKLLENNKMWTDVSDKLIYPENIAQVAQFAKLGVIDAALVSESNAKRLDKKDSSCLIPIKTSDYPVIAQQLVIISKSKNRKLAKHFIQFLDSDNAKSLIKNMGYLLPNSAKIQSLPQVK